MIYFKKVYVHGIDQRQLEQALRKLSINNKQSLDFPTELNVGTDKYFFGFEGKRGLQVTRVRTLFERFIPKLIIRVPLANDAAYYEMRLAMLPFILLTLISFSILLVAFKMIFYPDDIGDPGSFLVLAAIYAGLLLLEYKLITARVRKAITKYQEKLA